GRRGGVLSQNRRGAQKGGGDGGGEQMRFHDELLDLAAAPVGALGGHKARGWDGWQAVPAHDQPAVMAAGACFSLRVTSSSAIVGWTAQVASHWALVRPALTAMAANWIISGLSGPTMWQPTTRWL